MFECDFKAGRDAIEILRQQVLAEIPGRDPRRPRHAIALVGAQQHAAALLAHVDLALEIDDVHQFLLPLEFGQIVGDQVLVLHGQYRQLETHEATDLACPQAAGVDHVFGMHVAVIGDDIPAAIDARLGIDHARLAHDLRAAQLRRLRVGMRDAVGVDMAFDRVVDRGHEALLIEQGIELAGFRGRDDLELHAQIAAARLGHLQPVDALGGAGQHEPARDVQAARLPRDALELLIEVDRVLLQLGDVRVTVDRMHAARGMPGRPRGEFGALDEQDVFPSCLGQVIGHARAHHAAANDHHAGFATHIGSS